MFFNSVCFGVRSWFEPRIFLIFFSAGIALVYEADLRHQCFFSTRMASVYEADLDHHFFLASFEAFGTNVVLQFF